MACIKFNITERRVTEGGATEFAAIRRIRGDMPRLATYDLPLILHALTMAGAKEVKPDEGSRGFAYTFSFNF